MCIRDRLLSFNKQVTAANVTSRWNQYAGDFQRTARTVKSLQIWVRAARVLCVEEQPLVPAGFGHRDVAAAIRIIDDRVKGLRPPRYKVEKELCRGAGIKSLESINDENANRVQDWLAKELQAAFQECASTRGRLELDDWKKSLTLNEWVEPVDTQLQDAVNAFQQAHDRLVQGENGPEIFSTSSRTQMAKAIGALQSPIDLQIVDSEKVWKELFGFGELIIKLTSESLAVREGLEGAELLADFKARIGKSASLTLDLLFRLRCRGDHADDVSKRPEWEQSQFEVAKLLGRAKPKFKKSDSELLFRPDDLQLSPLEANELRVITLNNLAVAFGVLHAQIA